MRIVIDLQGAQVQSQLGEIERYALYLALAVVKNKESHEVLIVLNGSLPENIEQIRLAFSNLLPSDHIKVWFSYHSFDHTKSNNKLQNNISELIYATFLESLKPDVILSTGLSIKQKKNIVPYKGLESYNIPTAVICYNLLSLKVDRKNFQSEYLSNELYQKTVNILKNARQYFTFSPSLNHVLIEHLNIDPFKIINIQAGITNYFRKQVVSSISKIKLYRKFGLNKPFLLYVDTNDESNNYLHFIKAFSFLPEEIINYYQVLIIGPTLKENQDKISIYTQIYELNSANIILADRIEDEDLIQLYNLTALCIFSPSLENFSLCVLEAIACGTPVLGTRLNHLLKEFEPDCAIFNPLNIYLLTEKIAEALNDAKIREQLVKLGFEQAKLFSCMENAKIIISSLENLHKASKKNINLKSLVDYKKLLIEKIASNIINQNDKDLIGIANAIAHNHPEPRPPQLLIDISGLVRRDHKTGIQRVVRSIINQLLRNPPQGYTVELVYSDSHNSGLYRYATNFKEQFLGISLANSSDDVVTVTSADTFLGLDLAHCVVLNNQAFYNYLRVIGAKVYFVIYDLLPILHPEVFPAEVESLHWQWMNVLAQSDGLICISQAVANEVINWLEAFGPKRICPLSIGWFHLGADLVNSAPSKGLPANNEKILNTMSNFPTFLMVGTLEPRKRQLQVLLAFERLWAKGYHINLVIVGKYGWNVDLLVELLQNHPEKDRRLFWLSKTSDQFLDKVYASASCLIAASAGEGFGLPLIEAAQYGIPIIARDIPVFREVAGEHAFYFSGNTAVLLADKIAEWLSLEKKPSSIKMPWITWKQSNKQLLDVILGNNWYHQWKSINNLKFFGNDLACTTEVGECLEHTIKTTGKAGYLISGLHVQLEKGLYEINIYGRWNDDISNRSYIEFSQDMGRTVVLKKRLNEVLITSSKALVANWMQEFWHEFEIRIWVDSETKIEISMIAINAVEDQIASSNLMTVKTFFSNETLT